MTRRFLLPFAALAIGLVALPACKKKQTEDDSDGGTAPGTPPAATKSDHLVFAQLNAKQIRDSALFTELKQAFTKLGETGTWDELEGKVSGEIGVKPTDVDAVTAVMTEFGDRGPKFVVIVTCSKAIPKNGAFGLPRGAKPDARGFYQLNPDVLAHFPDEKTFVAVHKDLADQYLGGFAKNRTGWPMSADLSRAASGHTLYVNVQMDKLPAEAREDREVREFADLMAAKSVTLTADLRGKELTVAGRATFPDAASATKARDKGQGFIKMATDEVTKFTKSKQAAELGAIMPLVKEAERALKAAKLEASGSDVTLVASYKADFDINKVVTEGVVKVREAAARMSSSNNLKQLAIAIHSYHDANGKMPQDIVDKTGKPILSWRVAVLPYIEQDNVYRAFKLDEPWDSPNNKKASQVAIKTFLSPTAPTPKGEWGMTSYRGISGPGAAFDPTARAGFGLTGFTDGTSNTIMLIETGEMVPWAKPGDLPFDPKRPLPKIVPPGKQPVFLAAFADGSVRAGKLDTPEKTLRALFTRNGGEVVDIDW